MGLLAAALAVPMTASAGSADPTVLDFGPVKIGSPTVTLPILVTLDPGTRIFGRSGGGSSAPFSLDFGNCGDNGRTMCTVNESFTPTAQGPISTTLSLSECQIASGGGNCKSIVIDIQGTGTDDFAADPTALDFGPVVIGGPTVSVPITVTLDPGFRIFGRSGGGSSAPFGVDLGNCGDAGRTTCTVTESFTPTTPGTVTTSLMLEECFIASGGGNCRPFTISVQGTGVTAGGGGGDTGGRPPDPGATPELDSVVLFGSGLSGLAGYALLRLRARRRRI